MEFLSLVVASYGLTNIITNEEIFTWLRERVSWTPFHCARCMSVWVGFALPWAYKSLHAGTPVTGLELLNIAVISLCTHAVAVYMDEVGVKF